MAVSRRLVERLKVFDDINYTYTCCVVLEDIDYIFPLTGFKILCDVYADINVRFFAMICDSLMLTLCRWYDCKMVMMVTGLNALTITFLLCNLKIFSMVGVSLQH